MTFFTTVEAEVKVLETSVVNWFNTNPIGLAIESDVKAAIKELETVAAQDLKGVVESIGMAVLEAFATNGISTQAAVASAIAAGISAAVTGFKAAGKDITTKTITTLATTVVNQVGGQVGATASK
jgi:hypothetical protein